MNTASPKTYDPRLRNLVHATQDMSITLDLGVRILYQELFQVTAIDNDVYPFAIDRLIEDIRRLFFFRANLFDAG